MSKKLSLVLSFMLLTGLINSVNAAINKTDLAKTVIFLAGVTLAGNYATKQNEKYTRENKDPDLHMNAVKTGIVLGTAVGVDILAGDFKSPETAVKVISLLAALGTQTE